MKRYLFLDFQLHYISLIIIPIVSYLLPYNYFYFLLQNVYQCQLIIGAIIIVGDNSIKFLAIGNWWS